MTIVEEKVEEKVSNQEKVAARPDLTKEIRFRISLPVVIPIIALVGIGVVVLLFGLFLLSVPKEQAPAVALALGLNILAAATFAASRPKLTALTMVELGVLVVYPVLLAVILVNLGAVDATHETTETAAASEAAAGSAPAPVEIAAANLEFDTDELNLPADEPVTLVLENQDAAPHNVAIYKDDSLDEDFFIGENAAPEQTLEYEIPALAAGAYYFRCDVHPAMEGRVTVK